MRNSAGSPRTSLLQHECEMDLGLKDKVIMVAAASKGLGYGIAQAVAQEGAAVSIGSRTEADILAAAETLHREAGVETLCSVLDARDALARGLGTDGLQRLRNAV